MIYCAHNQQTKIGGVNMRWFDPICFVADNRSLNKLYIVDKAYREGVNDGVNECIEAIIKRYGENNDLTSTLRGLLNDIR